MARVTKQPDERRQEIVAAARQLFGELGFDRTMIQDIASALGVAQGLVYHYFKSKTDILYAVIDQLATEFVSVLRQTVDGFSGTALQCLRALVFGAFNFDEGHKTLFRSLNQEPSLTSHSQTKMLLAIQPVLESLIARGNGDGSWNCRYPKETAAFILYGFSGYIMSLPDRERAFDQRREFEDILYRMLGFSAPPVENS